MMKVEVKKLRDSASLPVYATKGAAAADLRADLSEAVTLQPGERRVIPTGLAMAVPEGMAAILCARSGLASKHGIALANGIGVIDSDYRGEIGAALINLGKEPFRIEPGERICQLMLLSVGQVEFLPVDSLSETERGEGGFGSTGTK